jgi:plastocyanin
MALSCNPANQTVDPGGDATLFALGGTYDASGNAPGYTWTSSDGQQGGGDEFDIIYNTPGSYAVTVSDSAEDASASCSITVNTPPLISTTTTSTVQ